MTISAKDALASLEKHANYLQSAVHRDIISGMQADGLIDGGEIRAAANGGLFQLRSVAAAAAQSSDHARLAKWVHAACARLGYNLDIEKPLDDAEMFRMNSTFAGKDVDERIAIKSTLFKLGCCKP